MDQRDKQHGGLSTGFFLGIVLGVVITLLLTTKRGKRILKLITEEGMNKLSNFEDLFSDAVEEYNTKPQEPKLPPVDLISEKEVSTKEIEAEEIAPVATESTKQSVEEKSQPKTIRRFFKGIHRQSIN